MKLLFTKRRLTLFLMLSLSAFLIGCAATQVALEKKDLKVQTKMSKSIFLDLDNQIEKSAFIQVKNTSDKDIDLNNALKQAVRKQGYTLVDSAKEAAYIYQCNILYVGEVDPAACGRLSPKAMGLEELRWVVPQPVVPLVTDWVVAQELQLGQPQEAC